MNHYDKLKDKLPDNFSGGCFKTSRTFHAGHDVIFVCEHRDYNGKVIKDKYGCSKFDDCKGYCFYGRRV